MMLRLFKVSGDSLLPTYHQGDFVLASKIPYLFGTVQRGDVIVFRHRAYGTLIKTVASVTPEADEIRVIGTHDHSVDSREFGAIRRGDILGKVIWHIKRQSHAQPINGRNNAAKRRRSGKKIDRRNPS
jgi:signal peptidase I